MRAYCIHIHYTRMSMSAVNERQMADGENSANASGKAEIKTKIQTSR